ncbi:hypothetical protein PROFUN_07513 [Planoprotostelium fungivorum]|uniref:BLOC-1-related complex subunit 6 C-terminal helix domain-containing protein n=1 Tax=Planoprotostelium fungivorum TaxID=1890364 RepID=A0A2P6NLQ1_9EUKA|nr:hypothetical protein PROFUN_07513 [Planoprotostelium fungivorum]
MTNSEEADTQEEHTPSLFQQDFLDQLEKDAKGCSDNLMNLMANLQFSLSEISGLTIQHMELYKRSLGVESETIQKSMVDVSNLMARCHQLNETLKPVENMATQIKEMKKQLDLFENQLSRVK